MPQLVLYKFSWVKYVFVIKCLNFINSLAEWAHNKKIDDTLGETNSNKIDTLEVSYSYFVVLCYSTEPLEDINVLLDNNIPSV
jgi:hypothetical protein